jgi:hypothetical protein
LGYKDFIPTIQNKFLSYKDYQLAFASFFKKSGIAPEKCEYILPNQKSKTTIVALCLDTSSDDLEAFSKLKDSIKSNYALAIKQSDINLISPLDQNNNHEVQFYNDGNVNTFHMLMNEHGIVLATSTVTL